MKFGRYLTENLTPEWKRAYIDYRACKKAIKVIAVRLGTDQPKFTEDLAGTDGKDSSDADDDDDDYGPSAPPKKASASVKDGSRGTGSKVTSPKTPDPTKSSRLAPGTPGTAKARNVSGSGSYGATETSPRPIGSGKLPPLPPLDLGESSLPEGTTLSRIRPVRMDTSSSINPGLPSVVIMPEGRAPETVSSPENGQAGQSTSDEGQLSDSARHLTSPKILKDKVGSVMSRSPRFAPRSSKTLPSPNVAAAAASPQVGRRSLRSMTLPSPGQNMRVARSFDELYDMLEADEKAFFDLLEHEFDKVETFYHNREQDAIRRAHDLRDQLRELAEHRRIFHELYPNGMPEWEAKVGKYITVPNVANVAKSTGLAAFTQTVRQRLNAVTDRQAEPETEENGVAGAESSGSEEHRRKSLREAMANDAEHQHYNPERYQKYKRDLRNASMEFYRQLELIKNYRIMNITGFRKALKKFEKTTKIYCMEMYTDEKIARGTFAKGSTIDKMIKETEELFTTHFEHGNQKKARDRLRRQTREKTHYYSVFRTGLWLGLGFPAAVFALVEACHEHTRQVVPGWNGLLQIYGGFYLTIIFALLFQLNLEAFVRSRINFEFVMELSKPHLDYRSFAEIPSFLFMTLSYCFFFSFYRVATDNVDPTTWPLAWLVFAICFFLNPLDYFRRSSRYWFLRVLFRVITPGYSRVEFIAFFVADELNSLTYTIQNFYFIGCTYSHDWPRDRDIYSVCPSGQSWPYALLLCVPAIIRLIQCIKRYRDSGLYIHLVNAGKYLSSILQFCLFVHWRAHGRHLHDASFIVWVIFAIVSSVYTSSWDLVVDWSLFRPDSGLLRQDRGYSHPYIYYFAMVSNVLIRFVWIWYIPNPRVHTNSRSFYFALAEMLRRWQWNFFRVETEHLGNADAYRVTREIPLPYRRVEHDSDEEDAKPSLKRTNTKLSVRLDKIKRGLTGEGSGRGPNELNVGGRGHAQQREYEARRPGDDLDSRRPEGEV